MSLQSTFYYWCEISPNGCWEWTRTKNDKGYGQLRIKTAPGIYKTVYAHRFSYEKSVGPIYDNMFVCHHCDNPSCINPDHLFLGTSLDNMRDMVEKGRRNPVIRGGWAEINKNKTHCIAGHEFSKENTYIVKTGSRMCRKCAARRQRERKSR